MIRSSAIQSLVWLGFSLAAAAGDGKIQLDWADNSEADLAGYNVYRSGSPGVAVTAANRSAQNVAASDFLDTGLTESTTYYYVVTAVDTSGNESAPSNEASATTLAPPGIPGDANEDGSVTMADLNLLVDWILGRTAMPAPGSTAFANADVNGDGAITMADLNSLVDFLLGRIPSL